MKNTFGTSVSVTLFGESHGPEIGAVVDGLAPGLPVDEAFIASQLTLRRPAGRISTARQEADAFRIVSGVFEGRTTGTPLTILIPNADTRSGDYQRGPARPGYADLTLMPSITALRITAAAATSADASRPRWSQPGRWSSLR